MGSRAVVVGGSSAAPDSLDVLAVALQSWAAEARGRAFSMSQRIAEIAANVLQLSESTADLGTGIRLTAQAFRVADHGRDVYVKRIREVDAQVASWLPKNRSGLRRNIAVRGRGRMLTFRANGDGRVVEVFGDLANADHIALVIPGMDNDISDFDRLRTKATDLRAEMMRLAKPGETIATIAWMGYDTPDLTPYRLFREGMGSGKAKEGAKTLDSDVDFIRRVNPIAHLTVIGHSYGTVVLGRAMRRDLNADDAIAAGSPGMDATDRKQLGSPNVMLWATSVRHRDVIPWLPSHGEDPTAKGFHAKRFRSGGVKRHSDYFVPRTEALTNIAKISVGLEPTR